MLLEPHRPHHVDGKRAVNPACQRSSVVRRQIVAAGKHRHAGPYRGRAVEYEIGQRSAGVRGDDEVILEEVDRLDRAFLEQQPAIQPRPRVDERLVKRAARLGKRRVDNECLRRRVVENHQDMREQPMSGGQIDDAAAAENATNAPRHLPRLVQLLARQAAGMTHRVREPVEERVARKALQVAVGEADFRRHGECHGPLYILALATRGLHSEDDNVASPNHGR